ncbi:MAG: hypothetical protein ACE5FZ_03715 [Nitrospiria bacterium]
MKQFLGVAMVATIFFYAASVFAADFKIEGDFRVRGVYSDNLNDANDAEDDQQSFSDGRFRLKTTISAGLTSAVVIVDFTNSFNDPDNQFCPAPKAGVPPTTPVSGGSSFCGSGNFRFGTASLGGSYNIVGVRSAYLKFDFNPLKVVFGRKQFMLGHGLILDDTVDSIAGRFNLGPATATFVDGKLFDSNNGTTSGIRGRTGSDANLYILDLGMNHGEEHSIGFFAAYLNDRDNQLIVPGFGLGFPGNIGDTTITAIGLTADGSIGPINGRFEIDFLDGTIEGVGPTDIDLEGLNVLVGMGLPVGPANIDLSFLWTSGEDSADPERNINGISGNFVLGNILVNDDLNSDRDGQCASVAGGRLGSGGRSCIGGLGITAVKLSAGFDPAETCHTEVALIWAQTTEDPAVGADSDLGVEVDLNHLHKLDENLSVAVNLGYLASGDAWNTLGTAGVTDDQLKGVVSVNYQF